MPKGPEGLKSLGRCFLDPRVESVGRCDPLHPGDGGVWWVRLKPEGGRGGVTYFGPDIDAAFAKMMVREREALIKRGGKP